MELTKEAHLLNIEYVPIDEIKPYEKNAKLHPDFQIEQIAKSIKTFGFNDPVAVWNDEIVEGHGRYLAAKRLGMEMLPIVRLDGLTDEQRKAYTLAHNKITMNTGFDMAKLMTELEQILNIEMSDFGFVTIEDVEIGLDRFFSDNEEKKEPKQSTLVVFTIKPGDRKDEVIEHLNECGVKYVEK